MTKSWKVKIIALGLCAVLFGSTGFGLFGFGTSRASGPALAAATDLEDVTGQYSLDAIKESQYNSSVQKNTFPEKGEGNVIVQIKGDSVYDRYAEKDRSAAFSEFVASAEGNRYTDSVSARQDKVLAAMRRKGINYEFKYAYTAIANAVAVKVSYDDVAAIEKIDGVEGVYYSNTYAVPEYTVSNNNANVYSTGIYNTDGIEESGEGMKVAILDTGLDYTHAAFQTMPDEQNDLWHENDIAENFDKLLAKERVPSLQVSDVYVNAKVPYAFDYADNDANVYPSYSNHGTHVAGIIGGRDDNKKVGEEGSDETFVGVAPQAQLVIMKVFTDDLDSIMLGGADSADILAAVHDCAVLGVDVINMSLGTSCGFTSEKTDDFLTSVYEQVRETGISLIVAASNESSSGNGGGNGLNLATNPDSGTVGSPSTYAGSLSVASINGQQSPYFVANSGEKESVAFITNAADLYSNEIEFVDEVMKKFAADVDASGNLQLDYVVVPGVGRNSNYTASVRRALAGGKTIALVKRGDISFSDKVRNAMNAGAAAVIIYNHLSGEIRMSLADIEDPIPACSIDFNAGTAMVTNAVSSRGKITLNKEYAAGPFMSSFSSWGVTPDLQLKPEITAHGGEIYSAVPGGYDSLSGTSMAAPNMAGAVALLRQNLQKSNPDMRGVDLNALVTRRLMSTATIAVNPVGNPYSPRKQGAGLGNILSAIATPAYLMVPNGEGSYADKTKIEFGDDAQRTGVYTDTFTLQNTSDKTLSYTFSSYVFTETLALNKKTVEESAYMFNDADVRFSTSGAVTEVTSGKEGAEIKVGAGKTVDITVTVRLTDADKAYLNESFANGMYVEGYFRLLSTDKANGGIDLSLPFLGFYGDWSDAPLFDYSIYELAVTDADQSIEEVDKPKASARATTPLGMYDDGKYILPLGGYIYTQAEEDVEIFPDAAKAAISMYDQPGSRTIYELYMLYGGLLRGAKTMDVTITDTVTGEVVYEKTERNVRKSYANSGNTMGSPINIDLRPDVWGLPNNREYTLKVQGTIDWKDGKANNDSFEFNFHTDYEAPTIQSYSVRFDPYTENKVTKYRIYLDINVHDNQYVQAVLPCYLQNNELTLLTEHAVPVYSAANSLSKVSVEITDYYEKFHDEIYLAVEDYAMNQTLYRLDLDKATNYCDTLSFAQDGPQFVQTGVQSATTSINGQPVKYEYPVYSLELQPNESYTLKPTTTPDDTYSYKLNWSSSSSSVADAYENEVFAKKTGTAIVSVRDGNGLTKAQIRVKVAGREVSAPSPEKLTFRPVINKDKYVQSLTAGSVLELYPNIQLQMQADVTPWYAQDTAKLLWESSNESVLTVDENGLVQTHKKGTAYVTVRSADNSRVTATVQVRVVSGFRIVNYTLFEYHGPNDVVIEDELNVMSLDEDCFAGNTEITSVTFPKTLREIPENAFKGCTNLRWIRIPSELTVIGTEAFAGCTNLEKIILEPFEDEEHPGDIMNGTITLGNRAFYNCTSLSYIQNSMRLTTLGREAFYGCTSLKGLDIRGVAVAYERAFKNCTSLERVVLSASTGASAYMFDGCVSLSELLYANMTDDIVIGEDGTVTTGSPANGYPMRSVPNGMFYGCSALQNVTFVGDLLSIGESAFAGSGLTGVTIDANVRIGSYAFADCKNFASLTLGNKALLTFTGAQAFGGDPAFDTVTVASGNTNYAADGNVLYNKNKTEIVLIPDGVSGVTLPTSVTVIGNGAFAGKAISSISLGNVAEIGAHAFDGCENLASVTLPASLTRLGDNAFKGCTQLKTVTWQSANLAAIGNGAFEDCVALSSVTLPASVQTLGNNAFKGCTALQSVAFAGGSLLQSVGNSAFENAQNLSSIVLPASVTSIGDRAFANASALTSFDVPAVTQMGSFVFAGTRLTSLVFADGATVVGAYLMTDSLAPQNDTLQSVTLPASVKTVGDGAFRNCTALTTVDLSKTETIGVQAFFQTAITQQSARAFDIGATTVGALAFAYTENLQNVTLPRAQTIDAGAFYASALRTVTLPSARRLGVNAFSGTKLTNVSLSAALESYTSETDVLIYKYNSGKYEAVTIQKESMGAGAFADIETLASFTVSKDNKVYFADSGVLYARVANGYTLLQYPAAKSGESYDVRTGTVRIESDAFYGVKSLKKVTMPYELKSVGSRAFYASAVNDFTFRSVAAPVLESEYVDASVLPSSDILRKIFGSSGNQLRSQVFYANFKDYVAKIVEADRLSEMNGTYTPPKFGLHITYPENGAGYDNLIWSSFFESRTLSAYAPDETTIRTINALNDLPDTAAIAAVGSLDELNELHDNFVKPARALYNAIVDARQLQFVTSYNKLIEAESAVRAARAKFGQPAQAVSLKILSQPDKLRYYVGDTLDTTGLRVAVVYNDTSEEEISNYTVDKTVLTADDREVTVAYNGLSQTFDISVTVYVAHKVTFTGKGVRDRVLEVESGTKVEKPTDPKRRGYAFEGWYNGDELFDFNTPVNADLTLTARWKKTSSALSGGAIAGIVIAVVLVAGGAAAAVVLLLRKRKNATNGGAAQTSADTKTKSEQNIPTESQTLQADEQANGDIEQGEQIQDEEK